MREPRIIWRAVAVLTAFLTLLPGVAVPVVDAHEGSRRAGIEAEHDAGRCSVAHDHLACIQHASSASHPAPDRLEPTPAPVRHRRSTATADRRARPTALLLPLPRAPPLAG